jgi:hypothetical protein
MLEAMQRELAEVKALLLQVVEQAAPAKGLSASRVERMYHLRHGEVRREFDAGRIKATEKKGRRGLELRVMPAEARRVFGDRCKGAAHAG